MIAHSREIPTWSLEVRIEGTEVEGREGVGIGVFLDLLAPGDRVPAEELGGGAYVCRFMLVLEKQRIIFAVGRGRVGRIGNHYPAIDLLIATSRK